jgi:hypothetical protein
MSTTTGDENTMKDGTISSGQAAYDETLAQLREAAPASLPAAGLHGHARVTGTDTDIWGAPSLALYGTPDAPQLFAARPMAGTVAFYPHRDDLMRFAREVLTFLGEGYGVTLPPWRPASNGAGKRRWFLYRDGTGPNTPLADRYHYSAGGILVRYASMETAQHAADKLNTAGVTAVRWEQQQRQTTPEIRDHSSDDMTDLPELAELTEPVAVVLRRDQSVDVYGYVAVVDQRAGVTA